jgi:hypothetical protein
MPVLPVCLSMPGRVDSAKGQAGMPVLPVCLSTPGRVDSAKGQAGMPVLPNPGYLLPKEFSHARKSI